jgi:hypothetical protein
VIQLDRKSFLTKQNKKNVNKEKKMRLQITVEIRPGTKVNIVTVFDVAV